MSLRGKIQHASRKSSLSDWMARNFHWFAQEIDEIYRKHCTPDWSVIANLLAEHEGVLTKAGDPPTPDAVRMCYARFKDKQPGQGKKSVSQSTQKNATPPPVQEKLTPENPTEIAKRLQEWQLENIRGKGPR